MDIENKSKFNNKIVSSLTIIVFLLLVVFFQFSDNAQAKPVNKKQAEDVVKGWLKSNTFPFGNRVSGHLRKTEVYTDSDGEAIYFIVYLNEEGFVVVPADNQVEPIIAFVASGTYDPSENNPLGLVNK